jgi:hypothetical protein
MAVHKTQKNDASVEDFINSVSDEVKRADSHTICKLMQDVAGEKPAMWGTAIIGFGEVENTNTMGTAKWPMIGFSPRKQSLTLYLANDYPQYPQLLEKLGKHSTSKACLYIKRLSDVDMGVLREMIDRSVKPVRST